MASRIRIEKYGRYAKMLQNEQKLREIEKLKEEYRRRKEEEEREIFAIEMKDLEIYVYENARQHHTSKFEHIQDTDPPLILRRGQPFHFAIRFKRQFDLNEDKIKLLFTVGSNPQVSNGTLIQLPITKNNSFTKPKDQWDIRLHRDENPIMHLQIQISCKAIVDLWNISIESSHPKDNIPLTFDMKKRVYILFNPWCKADSVYMDNEDWRDEYVMNETGKIFVGSYKQPKGRRWVYGQFSKAALPAAMTLLAISNINYVGRTSPVRVVRALSAMMNSEDRDKGIIKGRWDGMYNDGIAPFMWTGSTEILGKYLTNGGNMIKYGQCWVFAGVFTTLCRALGIPCRPITNFVSAHDTDDTLTIDKFFDEEGNILEENGDSIWNYHVWNDCWMTRPDLPSGYGGWQAVDGTPQETSDGIFQTGPASLEAVRKGQVGFLYDSPFVFAEVNADIIHWKQDESKSIGWSKLKTNKYHIGRLILTKKVGVDDYIEDTDQEDITNQYKIVEGTEEERIAVRNAATYGNYKELFDRSSKDQDIFFDMLNIHKIMIGQPFSIVLEVENKSNEPRTIHAVLSACSVYYTGITASTIKKQIDKLVLKPHQKEELTVTISSNEYYNKLVDYAMIKIYAMATVSETDQAWTEEDDFIIEKPKLDIQLPRQLKVGQRYLISITIENPLNRLLQECNFTIESPGLIETCRANFRDILPGGLAVHRHFFIPPRTGKRNILIVFNSKQLTDVQGSMEVEVV